jgi:hypothetical protein
MDHSCNSGSIQSSSGGDEEQHSNFLNNIHSSSQSQFATFLDSSQNLEPFSHSSSPNSNNHSLYNLDSLWSKTVARSNPNITNFDDNKPQIPYSSIDPQNEPKKVTKNPKKRARSSRKAPTTVFTTDVANFRQMVQQFTGIPLDPFAPAPFAHRPNYSPFLSSGTIPDVLGTTATNNNNYHPTFPGNNPMGNHFLSFQTLLQARGNQNLSGFQSEDHVGSINGSSRFSA